MRSVKRAHVVDCMCALCERMQYITDRLGPPRLDLPEVRLVSGDRIALVNSYAGRERRATAVRASLAVARAAKAAKAVAS